MDGQRHAMPARLAAELRRVRLRSGRTQLAVAAVAGINRSTLANIERAARCPSTVVAAALSVALSLPDDLATDLFAAAVPDRGRSHPLRRSTAGR